MNGDRGTGGTSGLPGPDAARVVDRARRLSCSCAGGNKIGGLAWAYDGTGNTFDIEWDSSVRCSAAPAGAVNSNVSAWSAGIVGDGLLACADQGDVGDDNWQVMPAPQSMARPPRATLGDARDAQPLQRAPLDPMPPSRQLQYTLLNQKQLR